MPTEAAQQRVPVGPEADGAVWHGLTAEEACERLGVDPRNGLDAGEVERRRAEFGPNKLAEAETEPGWRAFLRQYRDLMQLVLLGAAIVSIVALQEFSTGLVILGLTVLNAMLGLNQEGKAAESVAALQKMLVIRAHVRRGGAVHDVPAEELVPGDVVSFEAGDKIPADGRLLVAATLEIEEAALTGESTPVSKAVDPVAGDDVAARRQRRHGLHELDRDPGPRRDGRDGDRDGDRGRPDLRDARASVQQEKTPLTRQLDQLTVLLTIMAAGALALVVVLGLLHGDDFDELFLIGISLAIAAIPTGLPAVVTTVLSLGTQALAAKGAIVKRLRSVETLGSTSAICSDKTGTLTLNQMTARAARGRRPALLGRRRGLLDRTGGSCASRASRTPRSSRSCCRWRSRTTPRCATARSSAIRPRPRSSCSRRRAGIDVDETRRVYPRVGEVPFDSEYKFMATFHEMEDGGRQVVRCFVKGAPDVLLARSARIRDVDGASPCRGRRRERVLAENDRLAGEGLRVLAVAARDFDPATFDGDGRCSTRCEGLTLLALVGIVDPPRREARDAIARCKEAGIRVRMITGDHATTAAAIAAQLGIEGRALTGTEFAALDDEELDEQVDEIGVVARVAPEDKVRLVDDARSARATSSR